jgi:hypothetical protein
MIGFEYGRGVGDGVGYGVVGVGAAVGAGVGHACWLHTRSWRLGHATPSCKAQVVTTKLRSWLPPPHVVVQSVHGCHSKTQSTGHSTGPAQSVSSTRSGQRLPPCLGVTVMVRVRAWMPGPQSTEHASHEAQALTTQSIGQRCSLHAWVSYTLAC